MSYSFSITETTSFTATHAKHMGAKVATDLKRMQRLYGDPSDASIISYEFEVIELLKKGYLGTVKYGYKRDGKFVMPTLKYTARDLCGGTDKDDDPGRIPLGADISNASFYSYLTYSSSWDKLTSTEQNEFKKSLPFYRGGAAEPGQIGYFSTDKIYSSGGRAIDRSTLRNI